MIQKNAWYNKGFDAAAPIKYAAITVTKEQLEGAMSKAKIQVTDVSAVPAVAAAGPPGAPMYVYFVDY